MITDPPTQELFWLLDIEVGGRVERFSTRPLRVPLADGSELVYREGLADFTMTAGGDAGELSVAVSISSEDTERIGGSPSLVGSWAALHAAGWSLERQLATLRRWRPGTDREQSRVVVCGHVEDVEYGGRLEPLELSIVRSPTRASRSILDGQVAASFPQDLPADTVNRKPATVNRFTWPVRAAYEPDQEIEGRFYPLIIGYPGEVSSLNEPLVPQAASPCYLVENNETGGGPTKRDSRLMVADGSIDAIAVRIYDFDTDPPTEDIRDLFEVQDLLGRTVTVCDFNNPATIINGLGHPYYAAFARSTPPGTLGGGVLRADGSGVIRGMGEVIRFMLERSSDLPIDISRMESERPLLDRWLVDTWLNEPVNVWEWIFEEFGKLAPIRVVEGKAGLFVRLMRFDATELDATLYLDADLRQVERVSTVRPRKFEQIKNEITLFFQPDRGTGGFREQRTVTGDADPNDSRVFSNLRCRSSQLGFEIRGQRGSGIRTMEIEAPHTWDLQTAILTLETKAAELALPHEEVTYLGPADMEERVEIGDVVVINDSEVGLDQRVALVDDLSFGTGRTLLDLVVLVDPTRVPRAI